MPPRKAGSQRKDANPIVAEFQQCCKVVGCQDEEAIGLIISWLSRSDNQIRLVNVNLTPIVCKALLRLFLRAPKLQQVMLYGCPIQDEVAFFKQLANDFTKCSSNALALDFMPVQRESIVPLLSNQTLEVFSFRANPCLTSYDFVTHEKGPFPPSLNAFFNALAVSNVKVLNLYGCNIGDDGRVKEVVRACRAGNIPIRIGVNGGSLGKKLLEKYGHPTAEALVESAFSHLELLGKQGFYDTCVSMKSSTVPTMVAAARLFRSRCDYPLHIGVTETGPVRMGIIKSAMGIGALLLDGIGDTIRVSLTDDPVEEVYAAKDILKAAGLRKEGVNIISCPTCGRTKIDLIGLVNQVDGALKDCQKPITVAVMGCILYVHGEARESDIGIAGGDGCGMLFEKGQQIAKLPYDELLPALLKRIQEL